MLYTVYISKKKKYISKILVREASTPYSYKLGAKILFLKNIDTIPVTTTQDPLYDISLIKQ